MVCSCPFFFNALRALTRQSPLVAHPPFVSRGQMCRAICFIIGKPASLVCLVFHMLGWEDHGGKVERENLRNDKRAVRIEIIEMLETYSLLGQFARTLVFAVAKEFDDSAFIRGKAK